MVRRCWCRNSSLSLLWHFFIPTPPCSNTSLLQHLFVLTIPYFSKSVLENVITFTFLFTTNVCFSFTEIFLYLLSFISFSLDRFWHYSRSLFHQAIFFVVLSSFIFFLTLFLHHWSPGTSYQPLPREGEDFPKYETF